jgi:hypothetical protein
VVVGNLISISGVQRVHHESSRNDFWQVHFAFMSWQGEHKVHPYKKHNFRYPGKKPKLPSPAVREKRPKPEAIPPEGAFWNQKGAAFGGKKGRG